MKKKTMRMAAWLMILVTVATVAFASNPDRTGTAGATELSIPVGARGIAIGGSYMVFATGADAIYYNPAGLASQTSSVEALVSSMNYIADIGVVYGALGVKAGDFGTLGFTIKSINFGTIPVTTVDFPDGNGSTYSPTYITIGATYAKALTDRISFGFTVSLVSERILEMSANGVAFNAGIQYHNLAVQGLDLAVTVKNIGPSMTFSGSDLLTTATSATGQRGPQFYSINAASFDLPSLMEIGLSYTRKFGESNVISVGGSTGTITTSTTSTTWAPSTASITTSSCGGATRSPPRRRRIRPVRAAICMTTASGPAFIILSVMWICRSTMRTGT